MIGAAMSAEAIAIAGVGAVLLSVMVPFFLTLRSSLSTTRTELRDELREVRRDLQALSDRVSRIEGFFTGPGSPPTSSPIERGSEPFSIVRG